MQTLQVRFAVERHTAFDSFSSIPPFSMLLRASRPRYNEYNGIPPLLRPSAAAVAEMRYFGTGYTGSGSKQSDMKEAAELFEQAAGSDNALSLNNMAVMLLNGVGVAKNKTKAFEYFNRSAALGNAWGINSLAACYINGNGVEANRRKGIELWQQAADMGNSQAHFNLGIVYRDGNGPCPPYCKDHSKAYRHFDMVEIGRTCTRARTHAEKH